MNIHDATEQAYKNGFEAGKPKWISVTERLPKEGEPVLVHVYMSGSRIIAKRKGDRWYSTWDNTTKIVYVSHWMHLPEPPKGEWI